MQSTNRYEIILELDDGYDGNPDNFFVCLEQDDGEGTSCLIDSELIHERWEIEATILLLCKRNNVKRSQVAAIIDNL